MTDIKLRKGMTFIHITTKKRLTFGKMNEDGTLWCITEGKTFTTLTMEELTTNYRSESEMNKKAKERRKWQAW